MEEEKKVTIKKGKTIQDIQRSFVIDSLFSILKAKSEKLEKRTEELLAVIKKLDINEKVDWPTILIKIMEVMKKKDQEIKKLNEKNEKLEIEISKLKIETGQVNESVMELVNINLGILDEVHEFKNVSLKKANKEEK